MAWDHLSINRPHLVYIILGGFTSLFMLCSSFIKERLYIGEATVATICGIIFGPHAADLINPLEWGNTDQITLEFSRIVLVVQCFAVGVELPKYYMEKHWRSVIFLLIPVMTFGWLITSLFIWWMILPLTWLESLCVSACVTATDPVLASSVVGKGKFAKRVPKHLRDLLSAESGCNDGMAFPFIYLALYLIHYREHPNEVAFHWVVLTILYECVFGAFYGFMIGYIGRHGIKYAEKHDMVDRESFLVFYFVLALFCAGSGSILGVDDLLVGFAAGIGFSNDGWFTQKTEESHVSNVIDLLINLAYFVYLGTIIPWEQFNSPDLGTTPWRLVVISIFVLFFRRIPIMLALKPLIPDIKTWREAMFAGHFGPIGVGAIFIAILARAELQTGSTTPLASYPDPEAHNYMVVALIWPITVFLVVVSILVHGSSIAVFTLGKHINTLTLTMSYTTAHEDGPSWMNRLPRITTISKSQAKSVTSENGPDDLDLPPGTLPPTGMPREFLRRQKEEDTGKAGKRSSSLIRRRKKKKSYEDGHGPGGPISDSAIYPQRRPVREDTSDTLTPGEGSPGDGGLDYDEKGENEIGEVQHDPEMQEILDSHSGDGDQHKSKAERHPEKKEVYKEGDDFIIENEDGDVIRTERSPSPATAKKLPLKAEGKSEEQKKEEVADYMNYKKMKKKLGEWRHRDDDENPNNPAMRKRGPALAYQIGNTIIVEDEDGEVVKTYELPSSRGKDGESSRPAGPRKLSTWAGLATGLTGGLMNTRKESDAEAAKEGSTSHPESSASAVRHGLARMGTWGWGGKASDSTEKKTEDDNEDDDRRIRFTIGGAGRRLTKDDFLREIQSLDPKSRAEIVENSDASPALKAIAKKDSRDASPHSSRGLYPPKPKVIAKPQAPDLDETEEETDSEHERIRRRSVQNALQLSRKKDAPISSGGAGRAVGKISSYDDDEPETAAERKRREKALKGVEDDDDYDKPDSSSSGSRGRRSRSRSVDEGEYFSETPAERRRREAALGLSGQRDGSRDADDDVAPEEITVPEAAVRPLRGIRFAESPVRAAGEGKGKK